MNKVIILGINSFTGKHFQKFIRKNKLTDNNIFYCVDKKIERHSDYSYSKLNYVESDSSIYSNLKKIIINYKADYIINLIGSFSSKKYEDMLHLNAGISKNIFDIVIEKKIPVKNILLIGSAAEYGRPKKLPLSETSELEPLSLYGLTKMIQTNYALFYRRNYNINVTIARMFNIIGPDLSPALSIGSFANQIKNAGNGDTISVGNLRTRRDFLPIEDAISAYWKILTRGKVGEIYNICSGRSYAIDKILKLMIKSAHKKLRVTVNEKFFKDNDIPDIYGNNNKLKKHTGWKKKNTIQETINSLFN